MYKTGKASWTRAAIRRAIIASAACLMFSGAASAANQYLDKYGPVVYNPHTKSHFSCFVTIYIRVDGRTRLIVQKLNITEV